MAHYDEVQEPRREAAQDYYAVYYWSNDPYEFYDLPGRRSDSELKRSILERLQNKRWPYEDDLYCVFCA